MTEAYPMATLYRALHAARKATKTIDGRAVVKTHGDGPMPIWGDRYTVQSGAAGAEPYKSYTSEAFVRARVLELTYYIQSLQQ